MSGRAHRIGVWVGDPHVCRSLRACSPSSEPPIGASNSGRLPGTALGQKRAKSFRNSNFPFPCPSTSVVNSRIKLRQQERSVYSLQRRSTKLRAGIACEKRGPGNSPERVQLPCGLQAGAASGPVFTLFLRAGLAVGPALVTAQQP